MCEVCFGNNSGNCFMCMPSIRVCECPECEGEGKTWIEVGEDEKWLDCEACDGTGKIEEN